MSHTCKVGSVTFGAGRLALIAGPCLAEGRQMCIDIAASLAETCRGLDIGFVFKASYDKANRSSLAGGRGPGPDKGLQWLADVRETVGVPAVSDVHETAQVAAAAAALDCLQIPAFLCRQTDLLIAAGQSGLPVNIKKGQFMAPWEMSGAVEKVRSTGNDNVMLTERGTFFGYNRLVTDFRGVPQMQDLAPVVFDATHSVQEPGGLGGSSGGQREYVPVLAAAALAAGADALFIETHPNPEQAVSDAACQIPLKEMPDLLKRALAIFRAARADT